MLQFEWDSAKARLNLAKHAVGFEEATRPASRRERKQYEKAS